jgi:thioredoxin reductase
MSAPCIAILGAGPGGLSAALWLKKLGLHPVLLESRHEPGGLVNLNFLANDWILGHPGVTGQELSRRFCAHIQAAGIETRLGVCPQTIVPLPSGEAMLRFADGDTLSCAALVLATGTRYRGVEVLTGAPDSERIVCGPHAFLDIDAQAGQPVCIVGGGDNAYENARLLLEAGSQVTLVCRSRARAQRQLVEAVRRRPESVTLEQSRIVDIEARQTALRLRIDTPDGMRSLVVKRLHILAGYAPNTAFLADFLPPRWYSRLRLDTEGYVRADAWGRTNVTGIYAAGDVCNPDFPGIISALALGAKTAKAVERDLRSSFLFSRYE